ncbi:2-C-methyl-D-erythritol 4-phosphate cytidylyltransferase [Nostoc sp. CHAB 5715]|uniref:2-C-methyl-D-erythritol 4-phosphate cytidylyltransferase n=1 Tax=Nostoc sp. CHAB 5715 TaxID=2780400 RepID=UPI00226FCCC9|nr:2-C-methyl-D-erythritol 4-phosphate cytidylyltransferase [Nostoc sp. CHAB 5715]MCC5624695.1 2-C-methyl-D-erythritol 4-phosphate cytidylyltransferase [Nostoc sp. CHAB 5715]
MTKILVIDTEEQARNIFLKCLEEEGFNVIAVENGLVGVQQAQEYLPDLIISDIMMPKLDGYGVLRELRENPATAIIPLIFVTILATLADIRKGMELGADGFYNGLQSLPAMAEHVLIHDGARCLATPDLFDRCAEAILHCQGLIAAVPVKDTIKVVNHQTHLITHTPDRRQLWAAQTPQGFEVKLLQQCHASGRRQGWEVTDDAALFEQCQLPVQIVEGEETNLKVTTPVDLAIAELILRQRLEWH